MHNSIGKRELLTGGLGFALRAGYRLSAENSPKMPQNPAGLVHLIKMVAHHFPEKTLGVSLERFVRSGSD